MLGTYASAILISLAAVVLGRGALLLCGSEGSSWLGPALGLAILLIACEVAIRAPGRAWTAVVVLLALCAAALWLGRRRRAPWPPLRMGLAVAGGVLLLASVPFVANARVGLLGVSFLNDTHWHLLLAEGLRVPSIQPLDTYGPGYPLGPHAIAATFAQLLGSDVDRTLTGLLMAVPMLTGLLALGALEAVTPARRWLVALLTALPYLAAAWFVQSAFKEPIVACFVLAGALTLELARREGYARPRRTVLPLALITAATVYAYSYPGLLWAAAVAACWAPAALIEHGSWRPRAVLGAARRALPALALGGVTLALLLAPEVGRVRTFYDAGPTAASGVVAGIGKQDLANLAGPLRAVEGLGIWLGEDFRLVPADHAQVDALAALAALVLLFGIAHSLARREVAWPAALAACAAVYLYARHAQSPYVAAKALMIPAPLVALIGGRGLLERLSARGWRSLRGAALAVVAVAFFALAFRSSYLSLRGAEVDPQTHIRELRALRPLLHGRPTLVLFYDDYFKWELLGVPASSPLHPSPIPASVDPSKPWVYGQPLDFDSVSAATLDRFAYAITPRTLAQSEAPANFHAVGHSRSYTVWQRVGRTPSRLTLPESGGYGAVLDCSTPAGRRVAAARGSARTRPLPVYSPFLAPVPVGGSSTVTLKLPHRGRWQLSLGFSSPQAVRVRAAGLDATLPANLDRPGAPWAIGTVRAGAGPLTVRIDVADPSPLHSYSHYALPIRLIAVPLGPARTVPLRRACGRFVDWYTRG